jgi:hypothetical protein
MSQRNISSYVFGTNIGGQTYYSHNNVWLFPLTYIDHRIIKRAGKILGAFYYELECVRFLKSHLNIVDDSDKIQIGYFAMWGGKNKLLRFISPLSFKYLV